MTAKFCNNLLSKSHWFEKEGYISMILMQETILSDTLVTCLVHKPYKKSYLHVQRLMPPCQIEL